MKSRSEIEEKYKWDLSEYYKDIESWQNDFEKIKILNNKLETYRGTLSDDKKLLEMLLLDKYIDEITTKLYVFIDLKNKEDAKVSEYKNLKNKLEKYFADESPKLSFIVSELNEISDERIDKLVKDTKFTDFDLSLLNIKRNRKHMLSALEENLMSKISEAVGGQGEVFEMFDSTDITFEDVTDSNGNKYPLNNANYSTYTKSCDRKLRETANKNLNKAYKNINYTLTSNYINHVKVDCTYAKIRNFENAFDMSLFNEEVDKKVYDSLIKNVKSNLATFYKYFDLKKKSLKLEDFYNYDVMADLGKAGANTFSYEQAFEIVKQATKVLGKDYCEVLQKAKDQKWIDVMPNLNKDTGAFSWGAYGAHPVVLLNFEGTEDSVTTLAHELGHMMHTYYSNKNNPSTKANYEIFVAEVASTVNELLLSDYRIKNSKDDQEKLFYIDQTMQRCYGTILRQTMFAEFEQKIHNAYENNQDTTTEAVNGLYKNLLNDYFGSGVTVAEEVTYEWSRIPHFYNSFYVYKYATGIISAMAIVQGLTNGNQENINKYKKFLSSGCTLPPVELLKIAGVDLNDQKTFDNAFVYMNNIMEEWEKLLKIKTRTTSK